MKTRFLALVLSSFLAVILLGNWATVQAQSSSNPEEEFFFNPPTPLAIAFNAELDGETYRPENRQQSDLPFSEDERAIVGSDERAPMLSQAFPWSTIGRIDWILANGRVVPQCTGTLIGTDIVLTNSHCLVSEGQPIISPGEPQPRQNRILFKLGVRENRPLATATVIDYEYGWRLNPNDSEQDWAILKIDEPLGEDFGYLGWRSLDFSDAEIISSLQEQIRLAGYSGDFPTDRYRRYGAAMETAGVHAGCSIEGLAADLEISNIPPDTVIHNCDTTGGSSGSSIIALFDDGSYYTIGLHAGWNRLVQDPASAVSSQEICTTVTGRDDQSNPVYEEIGTCRNRAVQVSYWANQAAILRGDS